MSNYFDLNEAQIRSELEAVRQELRSTQALVSTLKAILEKKDEALEEAGKCIGVINVEHGNYRKCPICNGENEAHTKDCLIGKAISLTPETYVKEEEGG